jgi:DNA polymerase phi
MELVIQPSFVFTLQDFWNLLVDPLFTSSHDRKYVGFAVFQKLLPKLNADQVPFVFSSSFLSCLINNLASVDNYLHKHAKATVTSYFVFSLFPV